MARTMATIVAAALASAVLLAQDFQVLVMSQLVWFDRTGARLGGIGPLADHGSVELSPDGSLAAVAVIDRSRGTRDIWMYDAASGSRTRFTQDDPEENWLVWSPDGQRVVHNLLQQGGKLEMFEMPAADAGARTLLLGGPDQDKFPASWSPDGRYLLYVVDSRITGNDIMVLPLVGERGPYPYLQTRFHENWAAFSPDGNYVAYTSTETGRSEVYVAPFPRTGDSWLVSINGGTQPRWRRDGAEIFYIGPDRTLMAAAVTEEGRDGDFEWFGVEPLFQLTYPYASYHAYDVSPDGQRFLVNTMAVAPRARALMARR